MGDLTQKDRVISIRSPLGEDVLLLNKVRAEERISELFKIEVELLYHQRDNDQFDIKLIDDKQIVGQPVSIQINQDDDGVRTMTGLVSSFNIGGRTRQFSYYNATIVPHVWLLSLRIQSRIFQQKTVPDILQEVFDGFEVSFQLKNPYKQRHYCVQYRESDFDFASRLMEEEGIFYYFEHTPNMDKLILRDDYTQPEDCPRKYEIGFLNEELKKGEPFESAVKRLQIAYRMRSGKVEFRGFNFELPKKKLEAQKTSLFDIGGNKKLEIYDYPGEYAKKYDGIDKSGGEQPNELNNIFSDNSRTVNNRISALDAQYKVYDGVSDCSTLTVGHRFELKNHPNSEFNRKYIVLSVSHQVDQVPSYAAEADQPKGYRNAFTCIAHGAGQPEYRPALKTRKPLMHGSQTAFVVGPAGEEIFTDKYGRIKVQFHWDRDGRYDSNSSCWVRVGQSWAGNKWGTMFIPRIGMEVIVDFLEGDPDQPIITGCVYNPDSMPPYVLPDEMTKSTIKSNSSKGGSGFNEMRFEDKKGKEQIFIHGEKNLDVRIKNDRKEIILNESHLIVESNQMENVSGDKHLTVKGDQNEKIGGSVSLGAGANIQKKAGQKYALDAGTEVHIKAGTSAVIEAGATLTLKVGGNFININSGGIFIKGTMVMINSGGAAGSGSGSNPDAPTAAKEADTANPGDRQSTPRQAPPTIQKITTQKATQMLISYQKGTPFVAQSGNDQSGSAGKQDGS